MNQIYFIFIIILLLVFLIYNERFKKKHEEKSFLEEPKVQKTIEKATTIDGILRLLSDISFLAG